jgi:uncharacterized membrane protein YphA (DoxX/SURF4 family)
MISGLIKNKLTGWFIIALVLLSGYLISFFESYHTLFISALIALNVVVLIFSKGFTHSQIVVARSFLGLLFIFSGIGKGIDPVGTEYRVEDYFIAFGMDWAIPSSLVMSVILNTSEFLVGLVLLLNIKIKLTSVLTLIMMAFFTVVTINDAINNPVPDCGCFGDALVITNWQTLYKNLVIDTFVILVFFTRNRQSAWFRSKIEWGMTAIFAAGFIYFQVISINHLPYIDFRNWKVGNKMVHENPLPKKYFISFKNINSGEITEYLSPNYPYTDSLWMAENEFVSQRVVDPNPVLHDLSLEDADGNNYTEQIIGNPGMQFMLIAYDLDKSDTSKMDYIRQFINCCNSSGFSFVILTSSLSEQAEAFRAKHKLDAEFYYADDIALKTMIRANPGLILLNNGTISGKWHYKDLPNFEDLIGCN